MKAVHVAEHRQMLEVASAILAQTSGRQPCQRDGLARLRLSFSRLVNAHCEEEGRTIRQAVGAGLIRPEVAAAFHRELMGWRAALVSLNSGWPSSRIEGDPSGFASSFGVLVDDLRRYIAREESELLDRL